MAFQTVFRRYELKYMLTAEQKEKLLSVMKNHMEPDKYGRTTIRNIYLDTDDYRLIRRSIEKPAYKEKIRLRSYGQATADTAAFVELKKKYEDVVYKRRLALRERDAMAWICGKVACPVDSQISREVDYFLNFYGQPKPKVFLSYEREAYYDRSGTDFRVTFDEKILCRQTEISLCAPIYGTPVLPGDRVLLELKCSGGIPLWMVQHLSREHIYKTSFSKYAAAYTTMIFPQICNKEILTNGSNI